MEQEPINISSHAQLLNMLYKLSWFNKPDAIQELS
jgi:hypothetical protein